MLEDVVAGEGEGGQKTAQNPDVHLEDGYGNVYVSRMKRLGREKGVRREKRRRERRRRRRKRRRRRRRRRKESREYSFNCQQRAELMIA